MATSKKSGIAAGVGFAAAAAVALRRRWRGAGTGAVPGDGQAAPPSLAADSYLAHLAAAVRIATVSADDDTAAFAAFRGFLAETYPLVHQHLALEMVNGHTLVFTWEGADAARRPILLMAHQDVVPVEPGTEGDWELPPFSGEVSGGHLWGRGTLDDKGSLIALLEAVETLLTEGHRPQATLVLAFGHDEEIGGTDGAAAVADLFAERGVRFEFVLDEGGAVVAGMLPGVPPLALIGVGEKASVDIELQAVAEGGHSSMPPPHTAVGRVAAAIKAIEDQPMPARFATQREFLDVLAGVLGGARGAVLRNPRLTRLVERRFSGQPHTNALIRTTAAATVVRGGVKSNVLPQEATAIVNFRVMPGDTIADVLDHVRSRVGDGVRVRAVGFGEGKDPAPPSTTATRGWRVITETVAEVFPEATVAPWILMGATDSRYFTGIADGVYRFVPFRIDSSALGQIHGTGERVAVASADDALGFYRRLIERAGGPV